MYVITDGRICEEKMKWLRQGYAAYVESPALMKRLMKEINEENIPVHVDYTQGGCYFTPIHDAITG